VRIALQHVVPVAAAPARRLPIQMKTKIGPVDDPLEREADRMADAVLAGAAAPLLNEAPPVPQRKCAECNAEEPETIHRRAIDGAGRLLQPREGGGGRHGLVPAADAAEAALLSGGGPLPSETRAYFEPRFGRNFSQVRVHCGGAAAAAAGRMNARAFTLSNDIAFAPGEYAPTTHRGRKLIAHELAHVVQQNAGGVPVIQRQLYPPMPIVVRPSQSVEVTAVDARQQTETPWYAPWRYMGPIANFFRGDVTMTSINTMVTNVIGFLRERSMDRLNVIDHGNENVAEIGDDLLASPDDVTRHAGVLGRLSSHFASGAIVHMQNCHAGQNKAVICALARVFGTPVYAGTGLHNPVLGFNFGDYVRCEPNGTFNPDSGRPSTPTRPPQADIA
jgi:uncharacterized protein DUF4157